ncbi:MAG TPA: acyl-CoA desaturase, partial [Hyphomonas sp.]|nr:acyl-CoA desaturase [Hyphomonas sp.]
MTLPRSLAIPKTWKNFNYASFFSAFGYPALGLALFITMIVLGVALSQLTFHWWYVPLAIAVIGASIFVCNAGIGPLHRILQHRAGELAMPGQIVTMINLV